MNCSIFIFVIILLIHIYIINYLNKLKKKNCKCIFKENYTKKFIPYIINYSYITIVLSTIIIIFMIFNNIVATTFDIYNKKFKLLYKLYSILGIGCIYILYIITSKIKVSKCDCDIKEQNRIIYYYSFTIIHLYLLVISVTIYYRIQNII